MARDVTFRLKLDNRGVVSGGKKIDQGLSGADKRLKQVKGGISGVQMSYKRLAGTIATLGVGALIAQTFRQAIQVGKEFEQQLADLEAITGISGTALQQLGERAKNTGKEFGESAANIIEAQKLVASQLAQKIDFGTTAGLNELGEIADQAVLLSKAAGSDLAPAVTTLTTAINQFNLPASEANRIVQAIAAGAKFGAAELMDQGEAIKDSGTSASAANVTFEQLNAAIQTLAANGIKGTQAGVGLRNIFIRLQTQATKLADAGYDVNIQQDGLFNTLEKLAPLTEDTITRTEIFGERAQGLAQILIANRDSLEGLTEQLTGTSTATEQAAIQQNTFEGATNRLAAVFNNELISAFQETGGAMTELINMTAGLIEQFSGGLRVINGWVKGNQELHAELGVTEAASRATVAAIQDNIRAAERALEADGLSAEQKEKLNGFLADEKKRLQEIGPQFSAYIADLQEQIEADKQRVAELEEVRHTQRGAVRDINDLNKVIETNTAHLNSAQTILADYTGAQKQFNSETKIQTETTQEVAEATETLYTQQDSLKDEIEALTGKVGDLNEEETENLRNKLEQLQAIEREIELRGQLLTIEEATEAARRSTDPKSGGSDTPIEENINIPGVGPEQDMGPMVDANEQYTQLQMTLEHIATVNDILNLSFNTTLQQLNLIAGAIDELIANGYDPQGDAVQRLTQQHQQLLKVYETQNAFTEVLTRTQINSVEDIAKATLNSIRKVIEARISEGIATQVGKALSSLPFPFNIGAAAAAAGTVKLLFNKVVPEFLNGGVVSGSTGGAGLTSPGKQFISINEDGREEFIMNAESTRRGLPVLEAMNDNPALAASLASQVGGPDISGAIRDGMAGSKVTVVLSVSEVDRALNTFQETKLKLGL